MLQGVPYTDLTQAVENNPVLIAPRGIKMPLLPDNWHELCNGGSNSSNNHDIVTRVALLIFPLYSRST